MWILVEQVDVSVWLLNNFQSGRSRWRRNIIMCFCHWGWPSWTSSGWRLSNLLPVSGRYFVLRNQYRKTTSYSQSCSFVFHVYRMCWESWKEKTIRNIFFNLTSQWHQLEDTSWVIENVSHVSMATCLCGDGKLLNINVQIWSCRLYLQVRFDKWSCKRSEKWHKLKVKDPMNSLNLKV